MKYVVLKKADAINIGINLKYHKMFNEFVIINEKELTFSTAIGENLETKAKYVNGEIIDYNQAIQLIK